MSKIRLLGFIGVFVVMFFLVSTYSRQPMTMTMAVPAEYRGKNVSFANGQAKGMLPISEVFTKVGKIYGGQIEVSVSGWVPVSFFVPTRKEGYNWLSLGATQKHVPCLMMGWEPNGVLSVLPRGYDVFREEQICYSSVYYRP